MEGAVAQQGAQEHAKGFIRATIGKHPQYAAIAMAVMVITIIVLVVLLMRCNRSEGLTVGLPYAQQFGNMCSSNKLPLWQYGSGDAGFGGSLSRATNKYGMATVDPSTYLGRRVYIKGGMADVDNLPSVVDASGEADPVVKETMVGDGRDRESILSADGGRVRGGLARMVCARTPQQWSPQAVIEAQALADHLAPAYPPLIAGSDTNSMKVIAGDPSALNPVSVTYLAEDADVGV